MPIRTPTRCCGMPKKEIRFGELVSRAGKPEVVSVWADPKKDRAFMKAVRDNRVVTLIQQPFITKKDFGEIGYHQDPRAAYLIFPKSLPKGEPSHVVGIKQELIGRPRVLLAAARSAIQKRLKPLSPRHREKRAKSTRARAGASSKEIIVRRIFVRITPPAPEAAQLFALAPQSPAPSPALPDYH